MDDYAEGVIAELRSKLTSIEAIANAGEFADVMVLSFEIKELGEDLRLWARDKFKGTPQ